MNKESGFLFLAEDLIAKDQIPCSRPFPVIDGVEISWPGLEEVGWADDCFSLPSVVINSHLAMRSLFENPPSHWCEFIKEIAWLRKKSGSDRYPVDLVSGVYFVLNENEKLARSLRVTPFAEIDELGPDFSDQEMVIQKINAVLENLKLREKLKETMIYLMPDISPGWADRSPVFRLVCQLGIQDGIFLDLGCGTGEYTQKWAEGTRMQTFGVDRQYRPRFYKAWKKRGPKLSFIRGDLARGIPFQENSIDIAVLEGVANHVYPETFSQILQEATRVLKLHRGILVVGPQPYRKKEGHWRFFVKEKTQKGQCFLKETSFADLGIN